MRQSSRALNSSDTDSHNGSEHSSTRPRGAEKDVAAAIARWRNSQRVLRDAPRGSFRRGRPGGFVSTGLADEDRNHENGRTFEGYFTPKAAREQYTSPRNEEMSIRDMELDRGGMNIGFDRRSTFSQGSEAGLANLNPRQRRNAYREGSKGAWNLSQSYTSFDGIDSREAKSEFHPGGEAASVASSDVESTLQEIEEMLRSGSQASSHPANTTIADPDPVLIGQVVAPKSTEDEVSMLLARAHRDAALEIARQRQREAIERLQEQTRAIQRSQMQDELSTLHHNRKILRTCFDCMRESAQSRRALSHAYKNTLASAFRSWAWHIHLRRVDAMGQKLHAHHLQRWALGRWRERTIQNLRLKILRSQVGSRTLRTTLQESFDAIRLIANENKAENENIARAVLYWGRLRLRRGLRILREYAHHQSIMQHRIDYAIKWAMARLRRRLFRQWRKGVRLIRQERGEAYLAMLHFRRRYGRITMSILHKHAQAEVQARSFLSRAMGYWEKITLRRFWVAWRDGVAAMSIDRRLGERLRSRRLRVGLAALQEHVHRVHAKRLSKALKFRTSWSLGLALRAWANLAGSQRSFRMEIFQAFVFRRNRRILYEAFLLWTRWTVRTQAERKIDQKMRSFYLRAALKRIEAQLQKGIDLCSRTRAVQVRVGNIKKKRALFALGQYCANERRRGMVAGLIDRQIIKRCWRQWLAYVLETLKERQLQAVAASWNRENYLRRALQSLRTMVKSHRRLALAYARGERCLLQRMVSGWRIAIHQQYAEAFASRFWARRNLRLGLKRLQDQIPRERLHRALDEEVNIWHRKYKSRQALLQLHRLVKERKLACKRAKAMAIVRIRLGFHCLRSKTHSRNVLRKSMEKATLEDRKRCLCRGFNMLRQKSQLQIQAKERQKLAILYDQGGVLHRTLAHLHKYARVRINLRSRYEAFIIMRNGRTLQRYFVAWRHASGNERQLRSMEIVLRLKFAWRAKQLALDALRKHADEAALMHRACEHFRVKFTRLHWQAWREYYRFVRPVESNFARERARVVLWKWRRFMYRRRAERKAAWFLMIAIEQARLRCGFDAWKGETIRRALDDAVYDLQESSTLHWAFRRWEESTSLGKLQRVQSVLGILHWRTKMLRIHLRAWRIYCEEQQYVIAADAYAKGKCLFRAFSGWRELIYPPPLHLNDDRDKSPHFVRSLRVNIH